MKFVTFLVTSLKRTSLCRRTAFVFALLPVLMLVVGVCAAAAQPSDTTSRDHEIIQELLERVAQLEAEVRSLRTAQTQSVSPAQVQPVALALTPGSRDERSLKADPPPAAKVAQSAPASPKRHQAKMSDPESPDGHAMEIPGGGPSMKIHGFADVGFHADDLKGNHTSFTLGQTDLFMTSRLSGTFSALAEVVLNPRTNNLTSIDTERLLLQYSPSDRLHLAAGRGHTAIGYYNTAYHHGSWFQTAIGRPFIFQFESRGGILPIHNIGLSANGSIPSGRLGLHYLAEAGNGRASRVPLAAPAQNVTNDKDHKAFNVGLYARPDWLPGLQTGFSVYNDRLVPQGQADVHQTITALHLVYVKPEVELLNEVLVLRYAPIGGPRVFHAPAFYTQVSRRFYGKYRPYFRYEYINVPASTPIIGNVGRLNGPSAGVRFDLTDYAALKIEYNRTTRPQLDPINGLGMQFAFTF